MSMSAESAGSRAAGSGATARDEQFMRSAIEMARRGLLAGEPPIGACLVRDGDAIATLSNAVIGELDITAHAEMRVIREACRQLRTLRLDGCRLFVTVEPCPMCMAACHYAGVSEVIFGASMADLNALTGTELMHETGHPPSLAMSGGCLGDESRALLAQWSARSPRDRC
jgi:guanine deaminase